MAHRRPARGGVGSPRHQVKYWLLHSGADGQGARAVGASRRQAAVRLGHARDVSVGQIHSQRTLASYLRIAIAFAEWCADRHGERSVPAQLRHPEWGRERLSTRGLAPATLTTYLAALLKLVEVVCPGRRARWLALGEDLPRRPAGGNRAWTPTAVAALVAAVSARDGELGLVVRVLDATGLRVGEVVRHTQHWHHALHAGQVEVMGDGLRVVGKGGKERWVPLPADLAVELRARAQARAPAALLFDVTSHQLYRALGEACAALGLRRDGAHALRYGFAQRERARLLAAGVVPDDADRQVSLRLGHGRRRITHHYLAPPAAPSAAAARRS
jgi:integrase